MRPDFCPEDLGVRDTGSIYHSPWLTTKNIILKLYVSRENPMTELRQLVLFVMKNVPVWFDIKMNHSIIDGATHVYNNVVLFTKKIVEDHKPCYRA